MKASSFRYLWEQVVFKRFLEFQAQFCMINKNVSFRLSTYAFHFLEPKVFY